MIEASSCRYIGNVSKPIGKKGFLQIALNSTLNTDLFLDNNSVFVFLNGLYVPFSIDEVQVTGTKMIIKFACVNSIDEAIRLNSKKVFVQENRYKNKTQAVSVEEDNNLVGYTVVDRKNGVLGKISGFNMIPENPLIEITGNCKTILLPAQDEFVEIIDDENLIVYVNIPEGLLDLF
jgi:16S rRNA processing protein RimM